MIIYDLYKRMLLQPHLLIAGKTGSGKSVLENNLIYTALQQGPDRVQFVFIDPKRVNLAKFKNLPHTITHARTRTEIVNAFRWIRSEIDNRFRFMENVNQEDLNGPDLYVFIDELMDIITNYPKECKEHLQYLCQVGRAARVHAIVCTQSPIREILPTAIKCNIDARAALRTRSAQDSRNILGFNGAEKLPEHGKCIYFDGGRDPALYDIPMIDNQELNSIISYWTR